MSLRRLSGYGLWRGEKDPYKENGKRREKVKTDFLFSGFLV
jgi:hypothetical protein